MAARAAHPSATDGDTPLVAAIAEGLAAVSPPWEDRHGPSPTGARQYELLLSTELYDAWLISWPPGSGLEAHDHGGSSGAFAVVAGVLDEDVVRPHHDPAGPAPDAAGDGRLPDAGPSGSGEAVFRRVVAGRCVSFGPGHVHGVWNRGDEAATSVHVYSPPLRSMAYYRADGDGSLVIDGVDEAVWARA